MKRDRDTSSHDPLDDLLAQARWPEPAAESTRRLTEQWAGLRRRTWRIGPMLTAAAACLILATGVWVRVAQSERQDRPSVAAAGDPPAVVPAIARSPVESVVRTSTPVVVGREPTPVLLVALRSIERRERQRNARAATAPAPVPPPVTPAPAPAKPETEAELARLIVAADLRVPAEVVEKFCALATARSLPLVMELSRDPRHRSATIEPMARLAEPAVVGRFARGDVTPAQRRLLCAALLARREHASLEQYLALVSERATRADALAAAEARNGDPPIDPLLAILRGPRADLRDAAAQTLGRINGPVLTRRLIEMVRADQNRREAMLALASSRGSEAREFVRLATESDALAAHARSALAQTNYQ